MVLQSTRDYRMGPIQANIFGVQRNLQQQKQRMNLSLIMSSKQFEIRIQSMLDGATNGTGGIYITQEQIV